MSTLTLDEKRDRFRHVRRQALIVDPTLSHAEFEARIREVAGEDELTPDGWLTAAHALLGHMLDERTDCEVFGGQYSTSIKVTGPSGAVSIFVERYLDRFHPAGYGTVAEPEVENADDTVTVRIRRANSCD